MAALATMQRRGGGRVPTATGSIAVSRVDLTQIVRQVIQDRSPHLSYGRAIARLHADPDAAHLMREAAATYTTTR